MKKVILLVEDDEQLRSLYKKQLELLGYIVESASDAGEGLAKWWIEPHRYTLVLTDVMMPRRSGLELAKALRILGCETSILAFSAGGEAPSRDTMDSHGITGFLPKPFTMETLDEQIKLVIT